MDIQEKTELNKLIRAYKGENSFVISLQKQLKSTKCNKIKVGNKMIKMLSEKQYEVAKIYL